MAHPLGVVDFRGRERIEPSVDSETKLQQNAIIALSSINDVMLVGEFPGGAPDTVKEWLDIPSMAAYHDPDGTFSSSIRLAGRIKLPSTEVNGAAKIRTVRVGNPTQGKADLYTSVRANTAQAGAAATITLDAAASAVDDFYNAKKILLTGGPGDGQVATISAYNGTTKVATVTFASGTAWSTNPTSATTFMVYSPLLTFTTADYGTQANKFQVGVAATGIKRTVTLTFKAGTADERVYVSPSTGVALQVEYTGSDASAVLTVSKTGDNAVSLVYATGVLGSESVKASLDLTSATYNTLAKVAAALATVSGTTCVIDGAADATMSSAYLDAAVGVQCKRITGTAAAGGASTITLTGTSTTDSYYVGRYVTITAGTGVGQSRWIITYVGSSKLTTVDVAWDTVPDTTSVYKVGVYGERSALGSILQWANSTVSGKVTAARTASATVAPDVTTRDVSFVGGSYPATVLQDWIDAFAVVDAEELPGGNIFVATADDSVYDALDTWRDTQKGVQNKIWRSVYAAPAGATNDAIKSFTQSHSNRRTMVVCDSMKDLNNDGTALVTYDPLDLAACLCGMTSGARPTQPLTGLLVKVRGLGVKRGLTDREDLQRNGVTVLKEVKGRGFEVAFALSSSLSARRMERVWSESIAADYIEYNVTTQLQRSKATWTTRDRVVRAKGLVKDVLDLMEKEGVISEGFDSNGVTLPSYGPITAQVQAGKMAVGWLAYIGGETDQIGILGDVEYQAFGVDLVV